MRALRDPADALAERDQQQPRQAVRFGVERISSPSSASAAASPPTKAAGSATCSTTSSEVTRSNAPVQRLHAADAIVDLQPLPERMRARRGDILRRRVDPGHRRAQPRQRLGEQPGPAADVGRPLAGERRQAALVQPPMLVDPRRGCRRAAPG